MKYPNGHNSAISFPLGGIGTGSIGLSGAGQLIDWEIMNRPDKGSHNGYSHLAVKAERGGELVDVRVLNGDMAPPYTGTSSFGEAGNRFAGYGFGANKCLLPGLPHFREVEFDGEFPFARLTFRNETFPGAVVLRAFNPLIPLNDFDSSLPAAAFEIEFHNDTAEELRYTAALSVRNPVERSCHTLTGRLLEMKQKQHHAASPRYGELALVTDAEEYSGQSCWYRGEWQDDINMFWNDFARPGALKPRDYPAENGRHRHDTGTLAAHLTLPPGGRGKIRFVLAWYWPNVRNFWNEGEREYPGWRNWYATQFGGAAEVADYFMANYDRLLNETRLFHDALFSSTLPEAVIDAVSANLAVLKSAACLRLENGEFYAFEGTSSLYGSCEGSCTHVWNYAYALPFLFPALERSMRELDYTWNFQPDGGLGFRLQLPLGREATGFRACVDGQMGGVIKTYREWKISGDTDWLRRWFPQARRALEYAWSPENPDRWDPEQSGVLTGRQHHTLDVELFGPNPWLTGFYHAALDAAARMADAVGEPESAALYRSIRARGRKFVEEQLFNGEYYVQKLDLADDAVLAPFRDARRCYWNEESRQIKYQLGNGCLTDQLLAQWHASLAGLDDVFDPDRIPAALRAIRRYNFLRSFRDYTNFWRVYALNDEAGTIICSWPHRDMPAIPIPYATEVFTGYEYHFAAQLVMHGMVAEGTEVVEAARARYDGVKRNPWSEIECGSNYARSMSSYSLLNAYGGFRFDLAAGMIGFAPAARRPGECFRSFWSLGTGWGSVEITDDSCTLRVLYGSLKVNTLQFPLEPASVRLGGRELRFTRCESGIELAEPAELTPAAELACFRQCATP